VAACSIRTDEVLLIAPLNMQRQHHPTANLRRSAAERETILTTKSNGAGTRTDATLKKEERAKEGAKAMLEYQANGRLTREKTERLRALRLAKEAADKAVNQDSALKRTHRRAI
jgi:hypothetical protein